MYVLHIDFLISMRSFTPVVMIELLSYKNLYTVHYLRCSYQRSKDRF